MPGKKRGVLRALAVAAGDGVGGGQAQNKAQRRGYHRHDEAVEDGLDEVIPLEHRAEIAEIGLEMEQLRGVGDLGIGLEGGQYHPDKGEQGEEQHDYQKDPEADLADDGAGPAATVRAQQLG